jgi:predicted permease
VVAVLDILLVVLAAGLLVRRKVITQSHITGLSSVTVVVFLPCLIFSNVIRSFDPQALPLWWVIPLAAVVMPALGLALAALVFIRELPAKQNLLPLASMQNAGYLVLPVGLKLFPDQFDTFALYCFLFILGFNPVLWSVGKLLSTTGADDGGSKRWTGLLTPPLLANASAVLCVLTGAKGMIPSTALNAVDLLGSAAVPVATFILGAVLGSISLRLRPYLSDAVRTVGIKLLVLPLLTVLVVLTLDLHSSNPLLARFFVIEAAAAPAAGIILQVRSYGGDEQKIGSLMLLSYIVCIITLPLWVAVWDVLTT